MDHPDDVHSDVILAEARELVPDLLIMLEARTGTAPLVAIAALEYTIAAIESATAHGFPPNELARFHQDAAALKELIRRGL